MNYMAEYCKKSTHDLENFFNDSEEAGDEIMEATKTLKKLQKKYAEAESKLNELYSKRYTKKYSEVKNIILVEYSGNSGTYWFSFPEGQRVDKSIYDGKPNVNIYTLSKKTDRIQILGGFSYEEAAVIVKVYNCKVNGDNTQVKYEYVCDCTTSFFDRDKVYRSNGRTTQLVPQYAINRQKIPGKEFIEEFFGVSDLGFDVNFATAQDMYNTNRNFETIIKTAPTTYIKNKLLCERWLNDPCALYKQMGITKETYDDAIKRSIIDNVYNIKKFINNQTFNKTEKEWLNEIERCKDYEKELKFYGIGYSDSMYDRSIPKDDEACSTLLNTIAGEYEKTKEFNQSYTFSKFINYVVQETINQGYMNVKSYMYDLRDYIRMCVNQGTRPMLYTSYLKQTHDVASRNNKITVSTEDENMFKSRYDGYKPEKYGDYAVIAPKNTTEVKDEGNMLAHCVASYIKRVIDGECMIFFLRKVKSLDVPYITVEVKNGKIDQARGIGNRSVTQEEREVLEKWAADMKYEYNA